jgi:hypothetical protein
MAVAPVTAPPFVPVKPKIRIGNGTTGVDIECAAGELVVEVEQDEATTETFCGTYTTYKAEVWTVTATVFESYGAAGLWNLVRPLVGVVQPFAILPDAAATVSADNPMMTGNCFVKAFPFFSGSPGEPTSFDLVLAVQGTPTFATTGTLPLTTEGFAAGDDETVAAEPETVDA